MNEEICFLDATELARRIRTKEISPVEVLQAHLTRVAEINPRLNAIVTLNEQAEAQARMAEKAVMQGDSLGPLHGVPITIKDCFDTAGIRTTRGSQFFSDRVPKTDATTVARLKTAGAILLGKTNTPEFAFWWETGNLVFGYTANPWNLNRTTGGSSGGEAAAIAAGLSPLGLGSDVGGSIRAPSHYCGIVGLKPTHGRIPLTGHYPEVLLRFMHVGPMARTVRDIAMALGILAGGDDQDSYAQGLPGFDWTARASGLPPLRVGWMAQEGFGPVDPEVVATVTQAANTLSSLGHPVDPVSIAGLQRKDWNQTSAALFAAETRVYFEPLIQNRLEELHPVLRSRLGSAQGSFTAYLHAQAEVELLRNDLASYFSRHDLLLCPVTLLPAHAQNASELMVNGNTLPPRSIVRTTVPFSLTGYPALSLPFGYNTEGLPIGVQLVGRRFDEATVLQAAVILEETRGRPRVPPISLRQKSA